MSDPQPTPPDADHLDAKREARQTVERLLPWGVSVLVHGALVVLALVVVWRAVVDQPREEPVVPVIAPYVERPQLESAPLSQMTALTSPQWLEVEPTPVQLLGPTVPSPDLPTNPEDQPQRPEDGPPVPTPPSNPSGDFFETPANARSIVFVIDASGSLIDTLPFVIQELNDSLRDLSADQTYAVLFFRAGEVIEAPPAGMQPATATNVRDTIAWMRPDQHNVVASGPTTPLPAIRQALRYRPDLMYILSDNITGYGQWFVEPDQLVSEIRQLDRDNRTVISTIQFLERDPLAATGQPATLERIADMTGGTYTFISRRYLNLE
jgi:hypothetical protein